MGEIGSEFSYVEISESTGIKFPLMNDSRLVFSGRTAIETAIKNENIKKVLMPSYCCDSMIEPFRKSGIDVQFYQVNYDDELIINIEIPSDIDCVLWCNYFGFINSMPIFEDFIKKGGIVIEDITHSMFSKYVYHEQSDYLVASVRKWLPVLSGGFVAAKKKLQYKPDNKPSKEYIRNKRKAILEKKVFLEGDASICKSHFLDGYAWANKWLANNYSGLTIDDFSFKIIHSVDSECIRKRRINNAKYLYKELEKCSDIRFLFPVDKMDCPLFVPVVILNGKRDIIREKLTEHDIYCPVHWPRPEMNCKSNLYDLELSLVCDQRYDKNDMQRIADILCM